MWQNNVKYTPPKRFDFRLNNFSGGICNTVTESRILDNEASDLLNVRFEQDGLLKKRNGFTLDKKYSSLLHGIEGTLLRVFVIEPYHTNKKSYLLLIGGTKMVYVTTDDRVKVVPWSRAVNNIPIDGCQFGDKFFFVDGGIHINMFKIDELESKKKQNEDGSDIVDSDKVWHYLITKPSANFTPKPKPAVKGEWKEEPYPGVEDRAKYRWYEPCEQEMADGYKGANMAQDFYATMIKTHKDRLYVAGNVGREGNDKAKPDPNMIYISDIFNPEYFPASLPLQTPPTGDKITCLRQFNDALIVGRKDDVYAINGNTNRDVSERYTLKKINTHTGMMNNYSADIIYNFLFYVGSDGNCYKLTSTNTSETLLATQPISTKLDLKLPPFNKSVQEIRDVHTGFDPVNGDWHMQVGKDTFLYNYRNRAWTRWVGVDCMQFINANDNFYYVRDDTSFYVIDPHIYYDSDKNNPEIKVPVQFYWVSKNMDFGMPSRIKQIRDTYLISEIFDNLPSDIRVKYEADYVAVTKEHNISSEVAKWNLAMWDKHRYVYKNIIRSLPIVVGRRCRNFKVFIGNGNHYKGVVDELPTPQNSEEGQLFYLKNSNQPPNIFSDMLEMGGIESTNGSEYDSERHIRTVGFTDIKPSTRYNMLVINKSNALVCSVFMYDANGEYIGVEYCSFDEGYTFITKLNTSKVRLSFGDETATSIDLQEISTLEIREYVEISRESLPNGFYLRTKRDTETREYYKRMYDKDLYQPVKVHEINGIYELRGYR